MKIGVVVLLAALAGACESVPELPEGATRWTCAGGASFAAVQSNEARTVTVYSGGERYTLPAAVSASGARYTDGNVEFWEHQGQVTVKGLTGGPYENCRS